MWPRYIKIGIIMRCVIKGLHCSFVYEVEDRVGRRSYYLPHCYQVTGYLYMPILSKLKQLNVL